MNKIETGGPAFPFAFSDESKVSDGMTLRDYFAAKAMQSAYLHYSSEAEITKHWTSEGVAEAAYSMADAMLEARK